MKRAYACMIMMTRGPSNHHGEESEEHQLVMNGFGEEGDGGGKGRRSWRASVMRRAINNNERSMRTHDSHGE